MFQLTIPNVLKIIPFYAPVSPCMKKGKLIHSNFTTMILFSHLAAMF